MTRRLDRSPALARPPCRGGERAPRRRRPTRRWQATTPESGASLASAPARVVLRFDEPVETALSSAARLRRQRPRGAAGRAVPSGRRRERARRAAAGGPPEGGLHGDVPRRLGGLASGVGRVHVRHRRRPRQPSGPARRVRAAGPSRAAAFSAARAVQYAAIALGLGVLVVLLVAWLPACARSPRPRRRGGRRRRPSRAGRAAAAARGAAVAGTASASLARRRCRGRRWRARRCGPRSATRRRSCRPASAPSGASGPWPGWPSSRSSTATTPSCPSCARPPSARRASRSAGPACGCGPPRCRCSRWRSSPG